MESKKPSEQKKTEKLPWTIPSTYTGTLHIDELKFAIEMAEKTIADSLNSHKIIIEKANTLFNLTTTILVALVGFGITEWYKEDRNNILTNACGIALLYFLAIAVLIILKLTPTKYGVLGIQPQKLLRKDWPHLFPSHYDRIKVYFIGILESYQKRILVNTAKKR